MDFYRESLDSSQSCVLGSQPSFLHNNLQGVQINMGIQWRIRHFK